MFIQGCSGDINGFPLASGIGAAKGAGRDLGYAVVRALRKEPQPLEGRLRFAYREIELPLQDPPSVEKCKKTGGRAAAPWTLPGTVGDCRSR